MNIPTLDSSTVSSWFCKINTPKAVSHKGQNGKVLIIGGSSLFHGAVLWSAEAAAAIVDMVHVASTKENNEIIKSIKTVWQSGIVISQKDIPHYVEEDDVILVGNGMMRTEVESQKLKAERLKLKATSRTWEDVLSIQDEGLFTRELVHYLITHFPDKQFVFDAGALQMMEPSWLSLLQKRPVVTPHLKEFQRLFGTDISACSLEEKEKRVGEKAKEYNCIIVLKAIDDIISDGTHTYTIKGGNAGLTKGGTGDILAGLVAGMSATSHSFDAAIVASLLLKKTAEYLFEKKGNWYTVGDILTTFPTVFHTVTSSHFRGEKD